MLPSIASLKALSWMWIVLHHSKRAGSQRDLQSTMEERAAVRRMACHKGAMKVKRKSKDSGRRRQELAKEAGVGQEGKLLFSVLTAGRPCMPTSLGQPNPGLAIPMSCTDCRHRAWKGAVRNKHSGCKAPTGAHPGWSTRVQYRV